MTDPTIYIYPGGFSHAFVPGDGTTEELVGKPGPYDWEEEEELDRWLAFATEHRRANPEAAERADALMRDILFGREA